MVVLLVLAIIAAYLYVGSRIAIAAAEVMGHEDCTFGSYSQRTPTTGEIAWFSMLIGAFWPVTFLWFVAARHNVRRRSLERITRESFDR